MVGGVAGGTRSRGGRAREGAAETFHRLDEVLDFVGRGREFGYSREFMVFDAAFLQLLRIVDGGLVADVEDHSHTVG